MKKLSLFILLITLAITSQAGRRQLVIVSEKIAVPDTVWVFIPAGYDQNADAQFPMVYLLHGWSGSYQQWDDIMNCQEYADKYNFILVCPDGLYDSWYVDSPAVKTSQYAGFFFNDLVPLIEKNFRVDKKNVFITGLSMGGHGALYLFSQKPGMFRSAGSLSGVVDLSFCPQDYNIHKYLGLTMTAADEPVLKAYSVTGNAEKIAASGKEIIFSCGRQDPFYSINTQFKAKCDELGIPATFIPAEGGHDYPYWKANIGDHLEFFRKQVQ